MSEYTDRVKAGLRGLEAPSVGTCEGCPQCEELRHGDELLDEGGFSWSECGICNSRLGGDRYVWHWLESHPSGGETVTELHHEDDCCVDCLGYLANGEEPAEVACDDCGATAHLDDRGTTCRECGRGIIRERD